MNHGTKLKAIILALFTFVLSQALMGQEETPSSMILARVDSATKAIAAELVRFIPGLAAGGDNPKIAIGPFGYNGQLTDLGTLWSADIAHFIVGINNRGFSVLDGAGPGLAKYVVRGEFFMVGDILRIQTKVVDLSDSTLAWSHNYDLTLNEILMNLLTVSASNDGVRRDLQEPDDRSTPIALTIDGEEINRTLHEDDEDWFVVVAESDALMTVNTTGSMDTYMELFVGDESESQETSDDFADDGNAGISRYVETGEQYLFRVSGYDGATGQYGILASQEIVQDDAEPNDTPDSATELDLGESISAMFFNPSDEDWYTVVLPEDGSRLIVYTEGEQDTLIELYDEYEEMITDNDDYGDDINAQIRYTGDAGRYFVKVINYDESVGEYWITARVTEASAMDSFEPDDSYEDAQPIGINDDVQKHILSDSSDEDWVQFDVQKAGRYVISIQSSPDLDLDTYIELYDSDGNLYSENDDGGDNYDARLDEQLETGTWYLRVQQSDSAYDEIEEAEYTLSITSRR